MNPTEIENILTRDFDFHGFSRYGEGRFTVSCHVFYPIRHLFFIFKCFLKYRLQFVSILSSVNGLNVIVNRLIVGILILRLVYKPRCTCTLFVISTSFLYISFIVSFSKVIMQILFGQRFGYF